MGVKERREREREQTRQAILDAARSLLQEVGAAGFSLREVARRAEYSPASLYEYFKDRQAILLALYREGFALFGAALNAVPKEQAALDRLRSIAHAYAQFARDYPEHYLLMFGPPVADFTPTDEARGEAYQTFEILAHTIAAGVAEGVFRPLDQNGVLMAAVTCWSALHGYVTLDRSYNMGEMTCQPDVFERMLDQAVLGLANPRWLEG